MASVVIVDDAELFREALKAAFAQEGFDVVAVAADAMRGIDHAREFEPDLVILDLLMPGMSGLEVVGSIIKASPKTKVVLLTSSESAEDLLEGVKAGVSGYLTKDTPLPRLVSAMNEVLAGEPRFPLQWAGSCLPHFEICCVNEEQPSEGDRS